MPTISMFYGIIIRMYFAPGEHNPPHFHAYYNEYKASFSLDSLEIIDGELPRKQKRLVQAWAELHIDELKADWVLATNGEPVFKIDPLS
jgi:hypothetical protein